MADPISIGTMATIGMGANAAGGGLGIFSSIFGGEAKSDMYKYQAGVARINEQIAQQNADYARAAGEVEAQRSGMGTRFKIGQERVAQAASGIDAGRGSAVAVRASEQAIGQQDEAMIRANAARRAYGYQVEAVGKEAEARMAETSADAAKTEGYINAFGSLLGTASSVSSKWLQAKQYGVYGEA